MPATQEQLNYINTRWTQLQMLSKDASDKAITYLFLANSGGAIATLSFLGAMQSIRSQWSLKVALGLFVSGVFLVGVNTAIWFHHIEGLFKNWRGSTRRFFQGDLNWDTLNAEDDRLAYRTTWLYVTGYLSFACFVAGAIIGLLFSAF